MIIKMKEYFLRLMRESGFDPKHTKLSSCYLSYLFLMTSSLPESTCQPDVPSEADRHLRP